MPRSWRSQIADEVRACSQMKPKPMSDRADLMLTPGPRTDGNPKDPYTTDGAHRVLRANARAAAETMAAMLERAAVTPGTAVYLNMLPMGRNYILAAAMQTVGLIAETPSTPGQCLLHLTAMGVRQAARNEAKMVREGRHALDR